MFILSFISFVIITLTLFSFYAPAYAAQSIILKPGFNFISFIEDITMTPAQFKALSPFIEDIYLYSPDAGSFLSFGEGSLSRLSAGKGYIIEPVR